MSITIPPELTDKVLTEYYFILDQLKASDKELENIRKLEKETLDVITEDLVEIVYNKILLLYKLDKDSTSIHDYRFEHDTLFISLIQKGPSTINLSLRISTQVYLHDFIPEDYYAYLQTKKEFLTKKENSLRTRFNKKFGKPRTILGNTYQGMDLYLFHFMNHLQMEGVGASSVSNYSIPEIRERILNL